jgi:hypothetical protein
MGDELSLLSNDGRIATEKSGHIFLIVIDRPVPVEEPQHQKATYAVQQKFLVMSHRLLL